MGVNSFLVGDVRERLKDLADQSVHCCVTSPPYFGLRDYGHTGQIGLEPTPDEYVLHLVDVFREVRRVLRDDGTLWLNLGDSYNAHPGQRKTTDKAGTKQQSNAGSPGAPSRHVSDCKPKDLIGIPWMVAFALRSDGWYLRQGIIWHKPNPMPESVTDRCTKAHEYIFLFSKSPRYYFDGESIKEPAKYPGDKRHLRKDSRKEFEPLCIDNGSRTRTGNPTAEKRNRRDVWTVATQPYSGAHFATFPPDLIEPCILAGCLKGGVVLDPFGGAGTTGLVAQRLGRRFVLVELNPAYMALAEQRIAAEDIFS